MKEIGGFFELELNKNDDIYHKNAIALNSGRNCLYYILKIEKIRKIYIPTYICNAVIEPLENFNISYEFYNIDKKFEILQDIKLNKNEYILYVNYFALKDKYIKNILKIYKDKLILDYTHSFFKYSYKKIYTFYSPRKFFGVADGGFLYIQDKKVKLKKSISYKSYIHLIGRIDINAQIFYEVYIKNEKKISNFKLQKMSNLTKSILSSIDYKFVKQKRLENFKYLHNNLKHINNINIKKIDFIPIYYPLLLNYDVSEVKQKLIIKKIYIPTLWQEVLQRNINKYEKNFVKNMLLLPIDQRYSLEDMRYILQNLQKVLDEKIIID